MSYPFFLRVTALGPKSYQFVPKRESLRQCEQAPQVANSMLVGEWDNSLAQARDGRSGWVVMMMMMMMDGLSSIENIAEAVAH